MAVVRGILVNQVDIPEPGVTNGGATFDYNDLVELEYVF